jgi:hypothetical protein
MHLAPHRVVIQSKAGVTPHTASQCFVKYAKSRGSSQNTVEFARVANHCESGCISVHCLQCCSMVRSGKSKRDGNYHGSGKRKRDGKPPRGVLLDHECGRASTQATSTINSVTILMTSHAWQGFNPSNIDNPNGTPRVKPFSVQTKVAYCQSHPSLVAEGAWLLGREEDRTASPILHWLLRGLGC